MTTSNDFSEMSLRERLHTIIFEAHTRAGKAFDVVLLIVILVSVLAVCLESVESIAAVWGAELRILEWVVTVLFTIEYIVRLVVVRKPLGYALSFYGVIDLLAVLPSYLSFALGGFQSLLLVRAIRLLRVFRIFRILNLVRDARLLALALRASRGKITVFLGAVMTAVLLVGAVMYLVEGEDNELFTSIPQSCYWAVVTMTTVGYGDIVPHTVLGKILSVFVMVMGYGLIAVPTGIVAVELSRTPALGMESCPDCGREGHAAEAVHCMFCGGKL